MKDTGIHYGYVAVLIVLSFALLYTFPSQTPATLVGSATYGGDGYSVSCSYSFASTGEALDETFSSAFLDTCASTVQNAIISCQQGDCASRTCNLANHEMIIECGVSP